MPDDDGSSLSRRLHWDSENRPDADEPIDTGLSSAAPGGRSFERRDLDRIESEALDRRRQLWRDTAIILSALIGALLVANLVFPQVSGVASASPSPAPTGLPIEPSASAGAPRRTAEPIVDPSLGIDATPAPIPVITLPPTGTSARSRPTPAPRPSARPTRTPTPPTPPPTPAPTPAPTPTPEPTPDVTPIPAPTVHVSCTALPALTVSCSSTTTDEVLGSQSWDMGGPGSVVTGGNGSGSITFTYDAEGTYRIVLSITGLDGSSKSDGTDVTVTAT